MDVSKYHTRCPPIEHEEAVRMLLEGLDDARVSRELANRDRLDETTLQRRKRTAITARDNEDLHEPGERSSQLKRSSSKQQSANRKQTTSNTKVLNSNNNNSNNNHNSNSKIKMKAEPGLSSSSVDSGSLARCSGDQEDEFDPDRPKRRSKNQRSMIAHDDNLFEFNSEESGSREFIQVSPQVQSKRRNNTIGVVVPDYKRREAYESNQEASQVRYPLPKMQSKATSTASDSISTSGASTDRATEAKLAGDDEGEGDLNGNYEAIPSRTIAIQCDLRLSSVKRDGYLDSASSDLASMQASSISSTRYGFYRLSPEVIEQRRQLARSVSSRNIAEQQHQQYTPTTGAPLVARLNTVEAPTSISELSSSVADVGEFEPELARIRRRRSLSRETGDGGELRSIGSSDREPLAAVGAKSKHDQRFFSQRQRQQQMNSSYRQDSLPRRPKTALSYVSTSRLRGQQQEQGDDDGNDTMPNRLHSDEDSEPGRATTRALATESNKRMSSRSRAMSQQVLSSSARTTVAPNRRSSRAANDQIGDLINSNSDSELGAEKYRVPQQEELLVTKRGRSMGSSSPQVSRSSAIRNGPLFRRATQTLDSAAISQQQQANPTTTTTTTSSSSRYNNKREHNTDNGSAFDYGRSEEDNNNKIMREGASDSLDLRTTRVKPSASGIGLANYSMAEENQLAAMSERRATLTRQQQQTGHSISQAPRYSSMSLSRRPQRQQRSCNTSQDNNNKLAATSMNNDDDDREPDAGSIMEQPQESTAHDHQHRSQHGTRSTRLLRRDRAGSQQALPATLVTRTIRRVSPTTRTSTRTGEQQAQVGRSSSMKQQGGRPHHTAAAAANLVDAHRSNRWQHFTGPDDDSCDDGAAGNKCKACYGGPGALDERLDCDDSSQQLTTEDHDDDDEFDRHNRPTGARPIGSADRSSLEVSRRPPMASSMKRSESEDSESPLTRTWANPAHTAVRQRTSRTTGQQQASTSTRGHKTSDELAAANQGYTPGSRYQVTDGNRDLSDDISMDDKALDRKRARSHSMREISHLEPTTTNHDSMLLVNGVRPRRFESIYRAGQQHDDADELGVDGRVDFDDRNQHHQDEMPSEEYSICSSSLDDHGGSRGQRLDIPSKATTQAHLTNSQQQQQQQLDFDSQQRLNEIGLPEPSQSMSPTRRRQPTVTGSASHLGLSSAGVSSGLISRYATTGRSGTESAGHQHQVYQFRHNNGSRQSGSAITGRAMSQQSLTRPTMPLSRRLRRSGGTIGAGSGGSDVGGSSISLVSRLRDGSRYENAHTRDPVVMLIPQVNSSKQNEPLRASSRRASSRLGRPLYKTSGSRLSSQERKNRSLSRNGSDSDASSSMLRTLIKPRSTGGAPHARETGAVNGRSGNGMRRRGMASNNLDSDEENLDEIGQLASEIDSYKFRRRYSVPKDAKINWFSKLKQRVTSSKS